MTTGVALLVLGAAGGVVLALLILFGALLLLEVYFDHLDSTGARDDAAK